MRTDIYMAVWYAMVLASASVRSSHAWTVTTLTPNHTITGSLSFVVNEINLYGTSNE